MNDDLISRKSLIKNLNKFAPEHYSSLINELIVKEPTAYDLDAVCKEIERIQSGFDCRICPEGKKQSKICEKDCVDELIKLIKQIVRNGGKK